MTRNDEYLGILPQMVGKKLVGFRRGVKKVKYKHALHKVHIVYNVPVKGNQHRLERRVGSNVVSLIVATAAKTCHI